MVTSVVKTVRNVALSYVIWDLINNAVGAYKNQRHGCCDICCLQKGPSNLTLERRNKE